MVFKLVIDKSSIALEKIRLGLKSVVLIKKMTPILVAPDLDQKTSPIKKLPLLSKNNQFRSQKASPRQNLKKVHRDLQKRLNQNTQTLNLPHSTP